MDILVPKIEKNSKIDHVSQEKNYIDEIFELNNQIRLKIPKDIWGLMKTLSMAFYLNSDKYQEIQTELQNFIKKLMKTESLPEKLVPFKENLSIFKEFINKPFLNIFDKVNLELFSSRYQKKVVVYWISEDFSLNAQIFNKKFTSSIEIFRNKDQTYDAIFSQNFLENKEFCENIVFEIIDKFIENQANSSKVQHFHDIFLNNEGDINDQQKSYNPFCKLNPPDDFLKLARECKKTPNISNFSSFDQNSSDSYINIKNESLSPKHIKCNMRIGSFKEITYSHRKKFSGHLKFFDEGKNYGFFIIDEDKSDIFVHYDDLAKAKISKEMLKTIKHSRNLIKFAFNTISYIGKYNRSRKAIDIEILNEIPE